MTESNSHKESKAAVVLPMGRACSFPAVTRWDRGTVRSKGKVVLRAPSCPVQGALERQPFPRSFNVSIPMLVRMN